jgi:hypothetical protein
MKAKHRIDFKNKDLEWEISISRDFNCHLDDPEGVRKELISEIKQRWPKALGFVQKIERI